MPNNLFFKNVPKVELHRHLEGALRFSTMSELVQSGVVRIPGHSPESLRALVQVQKEDPHTFKNFLSKFETLRLFYESPEIIRRFACEAVEDASRDHVHYMELNFTPVALSRARGYSLEDVVAWVCESAQEKAREVGIIVKLILSVNRHEPVHLAEDVVQLAADFQDQGVVGISLSGNEAAFLGEAFVPVFREAKETGLKLTIHAGEWAGPESIRLAVEVIGADRITHGTRIVEDPVLMKKASELGVPFEVCVTSNFHSGVVPSIKCHPLPQMLKAGLDVTINTDDPSISGITLSDEYRNICDVLGFSRQMLRDRIVAAAEAAFLTPVEKAALVARIQEAFTACC